jgi:hypothetical protein
LSSCKKDERTAAEWGELASAKRNEIQALTSNIPCNQKGNVTIQEMSNGCSIQYFAIQASDLAKYEKLKKEYLEFTNKQYAAWNREGLIVDPCYESIWASEQPIRLDCNADKVQLITSENVDIDEAKALIGGTEELIADFVNAQNCTNTTSWAYTALINYKTMKVEFIPYSRTVDYSALKEKISLYNRLNFRVIEAAGTGPNFQHERQVDKIECIDGKPVIKFKN